jgi:hypothetical protein
MSKTDKTRPYWVKLKEVEAADPYRARRDDYIGWDREVFGCPHSCWMCVGSWRDERKRRDRTEKRRALHDWRKEYE